MLVLYYSFLFNKLKYAAKGVKQIYLFLYYSIWKQCIIKGMTAHLYQAFLQDNRTTGIV